jgi:uncharacterized protein YodC (DUF2158 family)
MTQSDDLKVGDIVRSKLGGGPDEMIIESESPTSDDYFVCHWFVNGEVKRDQFAKATLVRVSDEQKRDIVC